MEYRSCARRRGPARLQRSPERCIGNTHCVLLPAAELLKQPARPPEPSPSSCKMGVLCNANGKQVSRPYNRIERPFRRQIPSANERCVCRLPDPGLARHRKRKAIAELSHGRDCFSSQDFAELNDNVGKVNFAHMNTRPEYPHKIALRHQAAMLAYRQVQRVEGQRR